MSSVNDYLLEALSASFEELEEGTVLVVNEDDLAEVLEELNQAETNADGAERATEELEHHVVAVESLIISLEGWVSEGGMSKQTAVAYNVSMRNILNRFPEAVNQRRGNSLQVSVESIGFKDKLQVSVEALERTKAFASSVGNAVLDAIKTMYKYAVEWATTFGKFGVSIKNMGNALITRSKNSKELKEGKSKVKANFAMSTLSYKGSLSGEIAVNTLKGINTSAALWGIKAGAEAAKAVASNFTGATSLDQIKEAVEKSKETLENLYKDAGGSTDNDYGGGKKYEVKENNGVKSISFSGKPSSTEAEIEVPTPEQVGEMGTELVRIGGLISSDLLKEYKTALADVNKAVSAAEKIAKTAKDQGTETKKALGVINAQCKSVMSVLKDVSSFAASAAKTAYRLGNVSLSQYKENSYVGSKKGKDTSEKTEEA